MVNRTVGFRDQLLRDAAKNIHMWQIAVKQEKAIYTTMNMFNFDVTSKALIAEGWVPTRNLGDVQAALAIARVGKRSMGLTGLGVATT